MSVATKEQTMQAMMPTAEMKRGKVREHQPSFSMSTQVAPMSIAAHDACANKTGV